jgi:allophanate hydrolase subunit 1
VRLFDPRRAEAVLLGPGDKVRFTPITRADYDRLDAEATDGRLALAASVAGP